MISLYIPQIPKIISLVADKMLTTQVICGICAQKFYTKRSFYASTFATAGQSENTLDSKEDNRTISVFPLEVITGMATQYKEVICPKHPDDKVSLGRLIPDLLLLDILDMHRIEENIELGRQLGGGMCFNSFIALKLIKSLTEVMNSSGKFF